MGTRTGIFSRRRASGMRAPREYAGNPRYADKNEWQREAHIIPGAATANHIICSEPESPPSHSLRAGRFSLYQLQYRRMWTCRCVLLKKAALPTRGQDPIYMPACAVKSSARARIGGLWTGKHGRATYPSSHQARNGGKREQWRRAHAGA